MSSQEDSKRLMDGLPNGLRGFVAGFRHGWATAARTTGQPSAKPLSDDLKETAAGWGSLILGFLVLGFIVSLIVGGYDGLDSVGWISHREDTVITAGSNWLVGESKECFSMTLNATGAAQLGEPVGYAMSGVTCDDGPEHKMKVTFYGRQVQTEYNAVSWRCTKGMISFTCYQTGGER